ncbi:hypothetical protein [Macrococcus sp. DPC7161]|uniref:hypothetical protein n=1 Tax=Macrococcus sp. DPC7161 TaxID=2507060 RepID=UPI00100B30E3|nr:hypothetical protein [Macrococcus sp. DPC7161]RXK18470.1 hypothetical protein ER639_04120 [Macrococcus sp. DPC7161]
MKKNIESIIIGLLCFGITILIAFLLFGNHEKKSEQHDTSDTNVASKDKKDEIKTVRLSKGAVLQVNDKAYKQEDIDFLASMQKAQIQKEQMKHKDDKDYDKSFYEQKIKDQSSDNLQFQNRIELDTVTDLTKQKGYNVSDEQLKEAVNAFKSNFKDTEAYKSMHHQLGEDVFNKKLNQLVYDFEMRKRLIQEITKIVKADHKGIKGQELDLEIRKYFEDLYKDAMNDMEIATKYSAQK